MTPPKTLAPVRHCNECGREIPSYDRGRTCPACRKQRERDRNRIRAALEDVRLERFAAWVDQLPTASELEPPGPFLAPSHTAARPEYREPTLSPSLGESCPICGIRGSHASFGARARCFDVLESFIRHNDFSSGERAVA